jgi:hypothetical protein
VDLRSFQPKRGIRGLHSIFSLFRYGSHKIQKLIWFEMRNVFRRNIRQQMETAPSVMSNAALEVAKTTILSTIASLRNFSQQKCLFSVYRSHDRGRVGREERLMPPLRSATGQAWLVLMGEGAHEEDS